MRHLLLLLAGLLVAAIPTRAADERPNVILILVDDLGWTDLGCQGSDLYQTPNIDELARDGMRFTQAYAACTVCSPTRAAVLTGKYPARLHLTDWIHGHKRPRAKLLPPAWTEYLPREETTLAECLKKAGYATAHMGKWHLGNKEEGWPDAHGFDLNLGGYHRGQPPSYFSPYRIPSLEDGPKGENLTDRLGAEAAKFIATHRDEPFFLYLPTYAVHTPLQTKPELRSKYQELTQPSLRHQNPTYAGMIESLDQAVGKIMAALEQHQLSKQTIVIFTSDNGGLKLRKVTNNAPLRAGKGSNYEGGVRVPAIIRWPGVVPPNSVCAEPIISMDFLPTILAVTKTQDSLPAKTPVDGINLMSVLKNPKASLERSALYWHYPHYHPGGATPYGAIRAGDWKLIEFYEDNRRELYHLAEDLGENTNLAAEMPERVAELQQRLANWRKAVGAQMPRANPNARLRR